MTKEFVLIKDYTAVNFRVFKPKTHLDYLAAGMEKHGLIVGLKGNAGRKIGGASNSVKIDYDVALIRTARMNAGLSQIQLGVLLGISGGYISFLENGQRRSLTEDRARRLSEFLQSNGVTISSK